MSAGRIRTAGVRLYRASKPSNLLATLAVSDTGIADAVRLAACWNAFDGIPTDDIELMAESDSLKLALNKMHSERAELLAALQKLADQVEIGYFDHVATDYPNSALLVARAAIAKAVQS